MGNYEALAIEILKTAFGGRWIRDDSRIFSFGPDAGIGQVDGTIDGRIAVEIGVGSPKQIRASVLDMALHPYPGKLLVLVDTPGHSTERSASQAEALLESLGCSGVVFRLDERQDLGQIAAELAQLVAEYGVLNGDDSYDPPR